MDPSGGKRSSRRRSAYGIIGVLKIVGVMISVRSSASGAYCGRLCNRLPKVILNIYAVGPGGTPILRRTIYKYRDNVEQVGRAKLLNYVGYSIW